MPNITSIVEIIQLMLAPGIMISACGLLLLGMNNKYSLVVNRVRLLNEERRKIIHKTAEDKDFNYQETQRLESISMQISSLVYRVRLVRNAVLCYTVAVALFVLTSISIGFVFLLDVTKINSLIIALFLLGMLCVLCGVMFAAYETYKGYEIVTFEVRIDE
ncbi:MAG: DUF2721 domain-containing protein [Ignavibacteriaceae bacterium]